MLLMAFHDIHCSRYTIYDLANLFLKKKSYDTELIFFSDMKIKAFRTEFTHEKVYNMKVRVQDSNSQSEPGLPAAFCLLT